MLQYYAEYILVVPVL